MKAAIKATAVVLAVTVGFGALVYGLLTAPWIIAILVCTFVIVYLWFQLYDYFGEK